MFFISRFGVYHWEKFEFEDKGTSNNQLSRTLF